MADQKRVGQVPVALRPKYRVLHPDDGPKVAHVINFHRVGPDVVMSIGRLDVMGLSNEIEKKKSESEQKSKAIEVEAEVTVFEQIAMSPNTLARLTDGAQTILKAMVSSGEMEMYPEGNDDAK